MQTQKAEDRFNECIKADVDPISLTLVHVFTCLNKICPKLRKSIIKIIIIIIVRINS